MRLSVKDKIVMKNLKNAVLRRETDAIHVKNRYRAVPSSRAAFAV
jgi:hypothetical protein